MYVCLFECSAGEKTTRSISKKTRKPKYQLAITDAHTEDSSTEWSGGLVRPQAENRQKGLEIGRVEVEYACVLIL